LNLARRNLDGAASLVPGALVVLLGFQAGGFFPGSWSTVAAAVAVLLALRIALAGRPFAGLGPAAAVVAAALALLGVWIVLSAGWSHAPARALLEFVRLLAYGLVFVLLVSLPGGARAGWTLRGVLVGIAVVCIAALVTRLAPDLWAAPLEPNVRLRYPITYWNGLGLLAGVGGILALHATASAREPWWSRLLGAALLPAFACTVYLTFSRGAIAVTAVGVLVYLLAGRPRALASALVSAGVATAVVLVHAYGAEELASSSATPAQTLAAGHDMATLLIWSCAAALVARALLLWLDPRLDRARLVPRARRTLGALAVLGAVAGVVVLLAAGATGWTERQADRFLNAPTPGSSDARERLVVVSNSGRTFHWRVSLDGWRRHPWHGTGAGTYEHEWSRERPGPGIVRDAHSLFIETLGELGIVGLGLLVIALGALLAGLARRSRGPDRGVPAAALAVTVAWVAHAGVDWDWELTAVSIWVFGLGAAVLALPCAERGGARGPLRLPLRVALAAAVLVLALPAVRVAQSQSRLEAAATAFAARDCPATIERALSALDAVPERPEGLELIAYCNVRLGRGDLALRAITAAVRRDPGDWQLHYGEALIRGALGRDPRPAARRAHQLNPLDPSAESAVRAFRTRSRAAWIRQARALPLPFS
jgi:hypothetical protein